MEEDRQRKLLLFEGGGVADLGQVEDWGSTASTSRPPGSYFSIESMISFQLSDSQFCIRLFKFCSLKITKERV